MEEAILRTVVYADLFDYPLTLEEIHRYLTGRSGTLESVQESLEGSSQLNGRLQSEPPYWFLAEREHLVRLRRERQAFSSALWPKARRYGRLMASLPFVRMVAVTGSLAMDNAPSAQDDVDLLIVAARDRVWLARGLLTQVVHLARLLGVEFCLNYITAEHRLQLGKPSLFAAHELAQMVPLFGREAYQRLLDSNAWFLGYLPNAALHAAEVDEIAGVGRIGQRVLQAAMAGRTGDALEHRERRQKIAILRGIAEERGATGTSYSADLCKGHVDDHAERVNRLYVERLSAQGMAADRESDST
jgi:hypothetical protein